MTDQSHLAENIIQIYKKHGRAWTELRGDFLYEQAWLDRFLSIIPKHSKILDLGCGSGVPIARYLIENSCSIVGVDASDTMLEMAKQNFPEQTWIQADMRDIELDLKLNQKLDQKFQAILAWDSFFHLTQEDQRKMFEQFSKFAEHGTALMFTSGPANGEAVGDLFGDALYHASLSAEEYRELLNQYGFEVVKMIAEDVECAGHTV
ncbi:trans-aconitate 2-methyltransferase [Acinetobacter sp. P8-3-8]|uniref:class I SAM-dependent methyltransferase n=1 Tax=Acinetobacter sp. P8-3-8 TaxID=1029823 RepID=UPI000248718C|nr:class I SAM-dependent methyltransferase [Acinetobacter sp. P8-3-8]